MAKSPPQQSDIVITADGRVFVSFLWDDLSPLKNPSATPVAATEPAPSGRRAMAFPEDEYRHCKLCPKQCGFDRTRARHKTCGDFRLRVATVGLSLGDEPEVRGERGSGAIMLSGCPLKCPSCHNPEMVADGSEASIGEFCDMVDNLHARGAHNIQILSPTVHFPALRVALTELKATGFPLPIILKSSGYESIGELRKLDGLVDVYLPDFKFGSCSSWGARAGVRDYFDVSRRAIEEMFRQVGALQRNGDGTVYRGVLVRHVRAPLPPHERHEIESFLASLPNGIGVSYSDNFVNLE
jgi:putative pyruvate formate lyase activating enzyme